MSRAAVAGSAIGLALLMAVAGCARPAQVNTSTVPTASPSPGTPLVCGVLPRRAVELAVGRTKFTFVDQLAGMRSIRRTYGKCTVLSTTGRKAPLLILDYQTGKSADGGLERARIEQAIRLIPGERRLPADLGGTGSSNAQKTTDTDEIAGGQVGPNAGASLLIGDNELGITLLHAPKQRNQVADVTALMRFCVPLLQQGATPKP